jgi:hypothetical protein
MRCMTPDPSVKFGEKGTLVCARNKQGEKGGVRRVVYGVRYAVCNERMRMRG